MNCQQVQIELNPSKDYIKALTLVYLFTIFLLLNADIPNFLAYLTVIVLTGFFINATRTQKPTPKIMRLSGRAGSWDLAYADGQVEQYDKLSLRFDAAIFSLFYLDGLNKKTLLCLFHDQLSSEQLHLLRIIAKSSKNDLQVT